MNRNTTIVCLGCCLLALIGLIGRAEAQQGNSRKERTHVEAVVMVVEGERALDEGNLSVAVEKLAAALDLYRRITVRYPGWRSDIVEDRIAYCTNELKHLLENKEIDRLYGRKLRALLNAPIPHYVPKTPAKRPVRPSSPVAPTTIDTTARPATEKALLEEIAKLRTTIFQLQIKQNLETEDDSATIRLRSTRDAYKELEAKYETSRQKHMSLLKKHGELERKLAPFERASRDARDYKKAHDEALKRLRLVERRCSWALDQNKQLIDRVAALEKKLSESEGAVIAPQPPVSIHGEARRRELEAMAKEHDEIIEENERLKAHVASLKKRPRAEAPEATDVASRATRLINNGDFDKAKALITDALAGAPKERSLLLLLGMLHFKQRNFKATTRVLESLVNDSHATEDMLSAKARLTLAGAYVALKRYDDARMELLWVVNLNPDLSEGHYNYAQVLLKGSPSDPAAALEQYREAVRLGARRNKSFELQLNKAAAKLAGSAPPRN